MGEKKIRIINYFNAVLLVVPILIMACNQNKHLQEVISEGQIIKGDITIEKSDTVFNGKMSYYDLNKSLISTIEYSHGRMNGKSIYYKNGKLEQVSNYSYDELNGLSEIYDSDGKKAASVNYFHGLTAGPQTTYSNDSARLYRFFSLDGWPLYTCRYENDNAIENGGLLRYLTHYVEADGAKKLEVFIYLIQPPHKTITYYLYDKDNLKNDSVLLVTASPNEGFFKKCFIDMPKQNHTYLFRAEAYYPIQKTTIHDILKEDERKMNMPDMQDSF